MAKIEALDLDGDDPNRRGPLSFGGIDAGRPANLSANSSKRSWWSMPSFHCSSALRGANRPGDQIRVLDVGVLDVGELGIGELDVGNWASGSWASGWVATVLGRRRVTIAPIAGSLAPRPTPATSCWTSGRLVVVDRHLLLRAALVLGAWRAIERWSASVSGGLHQAAPATGAGGARC